MLVTYSYWDNEKQIYHTGSVDVCENTVPKMLIAALATVNSDPVFLQGRVSGLDLPPLVIPNGSKLVIENDNNTIQVYFAAK